MHKTKTLQFNYKVLLIAASILILLALAFWGYAQNRDQLHNAPLSQLSKLENIKDGPRFVPPNEPVENINNKVRTLEPIKIDEKVQYSIKSR